MSQKIFIIHDYPTDEATWREWFAQDLNRVEPWLEAARGLIDHAECVNGFETTSSGV